MSYMCKVKKTFRHRLGVLTCKDALHSTLLEGPYPNTGVVTGRRKPTIIRAETDTSDSFSRCRALPCRQIVHVGFEVFYYPRFVRRGEIGSGMCEGESTDGGIVGLEDCLEIEREAVPKCEFPTR